MRMKFTETILLFQTLYITNFFTETWHIRSQLYILVKKKMLASPLLNYFQQGFAMYQVKSQIEISTLF
jgi:hypothetical protein